MAKQGASLWLGVTRFLRGARERRRFEKISRARLVVVGAFTFLGIAAAATFFQTDWSSGVPADSTACTAAGGTWTGTDCIAEHPGDQTGWSAYSSKDSTITVSNGGADLQLGTVVDAISQTSAGDFAVTRNSARLHTSDMDFSRGASLGGVAVSGGTARLAIAAHTPQWLVSNSMGNNPDPGSAGEPAVADLDNDGDYDLMIGESGGVVYGYENTGTDAAPVWTARSGWNTPDVGGNAAPALADLDNDGDYDLLIGEYSGVAYGYENTGTKANPVWTAKPAWNTPDVGYKAAPAAADLDGDGDYDLMIGEYYGVSYGYQNTGTTLAPVWTAKPSWNTVDIGTYASPALADVDRDGDQDLSLGEYNGAAIAYENTGSAASPAWTAKSAWNSPDIGWSAAPVFADLDGDGDVDMVLGSDVAIVYAYRDSGAITYSTTTGTLTSTVIDTVSNKGLGTINYTAVTPANTTLTIDMRAGDTAVPDGSWTSWQNNLANGADISALGTRRYVQYRATLSSTDSAVTPSLKDVTISYDNYPLGSSVAVISSGNDDGVALKLNFNPALSGNTTPYLSTLTTPNFALNIDVSGNYAYVVDDPGNSSDLVRVIDISNPAAPVQVGTMSTSSRIIDVFIAGNYAYLAAADVGLVIFDIGNPAAPVRKGTYNTPSWAQGVHVEGNYAYVADWTGSGLQIIDVSNPNTPVLAGSYLSPGTANRVFVSGNHAYLADGASGLAIIDISNKSAPVLAYTYPGTTNGVFVSGNHAYVTGAGLKILDVSNPAAPVLKGMSSAVATGGDIYVKDGYAYVADTSFDVIDVSDPAAPVPVVTNSGGGVYGIHAAGRHAYLANVDFAVVALGTYAATGTFTSSVMDAGPHLGFTTLSYNTTLPAGTGITIDARSGNTLTPNDGSWTVWQTGIANGGDVSALGANRYVQYRANLSTADNTVTPVLRDITFNFSRYSYSASMISSAYNSTSLTNLFDSLAWTQSLPAGSDVRIQIRTAPNNGGVPGTWSGWMGPDGTANTYWNSTNAYAGGCSGSGTVTCATLADFLRDGLNDQWLEYKVTLISDGAVTPTLSSISMTYATPGSGNISITPTSGLVTTEAGGTATFNVVLTSAPSASVSINLYSSNLVEGTVSPSSLTFTPGDWSTPRTVTVTGQDEQVDDGDTLYSIVTVASVSADPAFNDINPADVAVTNTDNDTAGITVTPASGLVTTEAGGAATFTVKLDTQPLASVTIGLLSGDTSEGTVSPASLTFSSTSWNTPQIVTVTGVDDVIIDGNIAYTIITAAATSTDGVYANRNASDVAVTNNDNDVANIVALAPFGFVTNEAGGFAPFTIALTAQPSANVTVSLSSSDTTEGLVTPASVTFTPGNWNTPQSGTIFGVNDAVVDGNVAYNIVTAPFTSADANFNGVNPGDIAMVNNDNDAYAITVAPASGHVTSENGGAVTFTIRLGAQPSATVTLALSSSDTTEGVVSPASLTFTPSDYSLEKIVTVAGVDDRAIDGSQTYTIVTAAAVSADANYNGVNPADVSVTNTDNDQTVIMLQNNISSSFFGNAVTTADVNCDGRSDLVVGAYNASPGEVRVYYGTPAGYPTTANWIGRDSVSGTVFGLAVAGLGDLNGDGCEELGVGASGAAATPSVYVFFGNAGGLPDANGDGIGLPADAAWKVTGAGVSSFGAALTRGGDFNGDGYLDLAVGAPFATNGQTNEGRVYVFLNSASGLPGTAGVATVADAAWSFESDASSGYATGESSGALNHGLAVANVNGDGYDDLIIGVSNQTNGQSSEGRVYAFYGSAAGLNDAGADKLAYPSDANWKAESDLISAAFGFSVAKAGRVNNDAYDDIIVGAPYYSNGQTNEGAIFLFHGSATGLRAPANGDGIVRANTENDGKIESNSASARLGVQVRAAGDINNDGYDDVIVGANRYSATGAVFVYVGSATGVAGPAFWNYQGSYNNGETGNDVGTVGDVNGDGFPDFYVGSRFYGSIFSPPGLVQVFLSTLPAPGFTVTPTSGLTTTESGGTAAFTVKLTAPPSSPVTINLSSSNPAEGTVAPPQLVFDAANWNQTQTVTVTGVNDAVSDGAVSYTAQLAAAVSADSVYNGLNPADVSVTNVDNDVPQTVSVSATSATETGAGGFTFTRAGEITADLTVSYSVSGTASVGVDYTALSGTAVIPAGSASVIVPIHFINDYVDEADETVIATVNNGGGYLAGSPAAATATILDDDIPTVTVWPGAGLVTNEAGGAASFFMALNTKPAANVTINLSSNDATEGAVTVSALTFTPVNWNVPQSVTVVGLDDAAVDGDISYSIITAAVSADAQYNGIAVPDVGAINRDDDTLPKVSVIATQARVAETSTGGGLFTVTRTGSTASALTVFYSVAGTAARGVDYYSLDGTVTIPAGSGSATVVVDPIQDNTAEGDETVIVNLAGATAYIVDNPGGATVVITDDEQPRQPTVNFALDQTVAEGGAVTVTAVLSELASAYPVTIPYTVSGTAVNPADHNAASGNLVIASGTSGGITFNVASDAVADAGETIVFTMGTPVNAQAGARTAHTVTITESNASPAVSLKAAQGGVDARLIVTTAGTVTVTATVTDPNPGDTHSYNWSQTNAALVDIPDGNSATFVFNPASLTAGFYNVRLTVTDNGAPALSTKAEMLLEVKYAAPVLSTVQDSDNDGIVDSVESYDDGDSDGIPDYLDIATLGKNEISLIEGSAGYVMRADAGLTLRLGDVAFAAGGNGAEVSVADIAAYGGGEGNAGTASAQDTVPNTGGYADFEIAGLPQAGQSARVVIPQQAALPAGARYRKYDPATGWRDFVVNANNSVASAPGAPGECPLPGDTAYTSGLTAGHYCVQLTIQDGGPNDMDGVVNHVIEDPGVISEVVDSSSSTGGATPVPADGSGGGGTTPPATGSVTVSGGGSVNLLFLMILFVPVLRKHLHRSPR